MTKKQTIIIGGGVGPLIDHTIEQIYPDNGTECEENSNKHAS